SIREIVQTLKAKIKVVLNNKHTKIFHQKKKHTNKKNRIKIKTINNENNKNRTTDYKVNRKF
ncbi:hypothetical protein JVV04_20480, partial [Vibrio cholerae O1]|uniref:hypothetical protein n=1 Tax=Vibrio cholerae TaxID=666 RepID=UPI001C0F7FEF